MNESRRQKIDRLFSEALERPPEERAALLDERCAQDASLRGAVECLLASAEDDPDFLRPGGALQSSAWRALGIAQESVVPPPKRVGVYRIVREIGRGGMSIVYLGERDDGEFEQRVAVKLIKPGVDTEDVLRRFEQERQILASLSHAAIARLYDGGSTERGHPYFVLELIEGKPIDEHCRSLGLELEARLELFITVCDAVQYAHDRDVVHRDLKPSNILVSDSGQVKLLDFGIAKALDPNVLPGSVPATHHSERLLTPEFASPEQVRGEPVTAASDVYQLGVLLYLLLAGRMPYRLDGEGEEALRRAICDQSPLPLGLLAGETDESTSGADQDVAMARLGRLDRRLREDLDGIVLTALSKIPDQRYDSPKSFAADVRRHLDASGLSRVLYEMLTGPRAPTGSASKLPRADSPSSARDLAVHDSERMIVPAAHAVRASRPSVLRGILAASVLVAAATGALIWYSAAREAAPVTRFSIATGWGQDYLREPPVRTIDISRDGTRIVYPAEGGGLLLRDLDTIEARQIAGAGRFAVGRFSPDGEWIVYSEAADVAGTVPQPPFAVRTIASIGGAPVNLLDELTYDNTPHCCAWEGETLFLAETNQSAGRSRILAMPASGGSPSTIVEGADGELLGEPTLLPGGEWLLFSSLSRQTAAEPDGAAEIVIASLRSGERRSLDIRAQEARYVSTGHLVYVQDQTLFAVPFDLDGLAVTGGPVALVGGVQRATDRSAQYAISDTGTLIYVSLRESASDGTGVLALTDWDGGVQRLDVPARRYRNPRVSPNGRQLAVQILEDDGQSDIWIYDLAEQFELRRLTQAGRNTSPIWTPDGDAVTFASDRDGSWAVYSRRADGRSAAEPIVAADAGVLYLPESWSPDGRTLSFAAEDDAGRLGFGPNNTRSLWRYSRDTGSVEPVVDEAGAGEFGSSFSPDGNWIAYSSLVRSGGSVFGTRLEPFPSTGVWHQLIGENWIWPAWSPADGTRLLLRYNLQVQPLVQLLLVELSLDGGRPELRRRSTVAVADALMQEGNRDYDITPDGERILLVVPPESDAGDRQPEIHVVLNWFEELKARVPAP